MLFGNSTLALITTPQKKVITNFPMTKPESNREPFGQP